MKICGDCKEEFNDEDLLCVGSYQKITECIVHDDCDEYYCNLCFDED